MANTDDLSHLGELLDRCVEKHGDFEHAVCEGRPWSSVKMRETSRRLAAGLLAAGFGPGDRILTVMPNTPYLLLAYSALWRAGLVVVPVHETTPGAAVAGRARSCGARALAVSAALLDPMMDAIESLPADVRVIVFPDVAGVATGTEGLDGREVLTYDGLSSAREPLAELHRPKDDLALIMCTGGTTGQPKGVRITHRALCRSIECAPFQDGRMTVLAFLPTSHIAGMLTALIAHRIGGLAVLVLDSRPEALLKHIAQYQCEIVVAVPMLYQAMLSAPASSPIDVSSVKHWATSGAPMSHEQIVAFEERFGGRIDVMYGLTESCALATTTAFMTERKPGSVGVVNPLSDCQLRIVGSDGGEAATGELGEVWIKGSSLADGYLDAPEDTAQVFAGGWLRTGDIGRVDADGALFLTGRSKDVIIRAGVNIYPGEVEDVISEHEAVELCAVLGVPNELAGEEVVGFVVLKAGTDGTRARDEIVQRCRDMLAAYKVPRVIVVDELPRTKVGKVDKKVLRERARELAEASYTKTMDALREALEPQERTERVPQDVSGATAGAPSRLAENLAALLPAERQRALLAAVRRGIADILGLPGAESVPADRPAHELGLDSVMGIELRRRLSTLLVISIPTSLFIDYPEPEALARKLDDLVQSRGRQAAWAQPGAGAPTEKVGGGEALGSYIAEPWLSKVRDLEFLPREPSGQRTVLLTGATGFIGNHLVDALLERDVGKIVVLVRPGDDQEPLDRLKQSFERRGLPHCATELDRRIDLRTGDLSAPRLGLSESEFLTLAQETTEIISNAAAVDWQAPFRHLARANVEGVYNLLCLAALGGHHRFSMISTTAVRTLLAPAANYWDDDRVLQGYGMSKLAAEHLVAAAAEQGISTAIFRPALVTASAYVGSGNTRQVEYHMLRAVVLSEHIPAEGIGDLSPVDYVARAVASRALDPDATGVFEVVHPRPATGPQLQEWLKERGIEANLVSRETFEQWIDEAIGRGDRWMWLPKMMLEAKVFDRATFQTSMPEDELASRFEPKAAVFRLLADARREAQGA